MLAKRKTSQILWVVGGFLVVAVLALARLSMNQTASAACTPALPTDKGTVTLTGTVPSDGTYRAWFRVKTESASANNFYLQVDQTYCNLSVGGGSAIPANTWTWIDYKDGTSSSKIDLTLTAGSHTFVMAGQAAGLMLDRIILTTDTACTPTGTGDNCGSGTVTLLGDINNDNHVNVFDLSILLSKWGTGDAPADLNTNGTVDIFDLSLLLAKWTG